MREIAHRGERVPLASDAYAEAKAVAQRVAGIIAKQGRKASLRWDDEYNDTNTLGRFVVMAED